MGLGLLSDVAIHTQIIAANAGKTESYRFLRRALTLFEDTLRISDDGQAR